MISENTAHFLRWFAWLHMEMHKDFLCWGEGGGTSTLLQFLCSTGKKELFFQLYGTFFNIRSLQAFTFVGPTRENLLPNPVAVLNLGNQIYTKS